MADSWTLPDWNGHPDTIGSNKDGQETSIFKKIASKDDQELRKSIQLFPFPPVAGRYPGQTEWEEYIPPMKQASVIWRREDEGGGQMSDRRITEPNTATVTGRKQADRE